MVQSNIHMIVIGTDPLSKRGGIAIALPGYLAALESADIPYTFIPTHHPSVVGGRWRLLIAAIPRLIAEINQRKREGYSVCVYVHAGAGLSLFRKYIVLSTARFFSTITLLQLHAPEVDGYLKNKLQLWLMKRIAKKADVVCVLTQWWETRMKTAGITSTLAVIPNPLPTKWEDRARCNRNPKYCSHSLNILTMARIEAGKGVDLVVDAMRYISDDVYLTVAGDGTQLEPLKLRVKNQGLSDRIRFAGWVGDEEKKDLWNTADIFCLPTTYDSFGMSFLEAMANGVPVIALDWGPISDVISDNFTGFLVKNKDPELIAYAIESMKDKQTRMRMGKNSRAWVIEQFSAASVGLKLKIILKKHAAV